jgi:hypothetical protein
MEAQSTIMQHLWRDRRAYVQSIYRRHGTSTQVAPYLQLNACTAVHALHTNQQASSSRSYCC